MVISGFVSLVRITGDQAAADGNPIGESKRGLPNSLELSNYITVYGDRDIISYTNENTWSMLITAFLFACFVAILKNSENVNRKENGDNTEEVFLV